MQTRKPEARNEAIVLFIHQMEALIMSELTPDANFARPSVRHWDDRAGRNRCLEYLEQLEQATRVGSQHLKSAKAVFGLHVARRYRMAVALVSQCLVLPCHWMVALNDCSFAGETLCHWVLTGQVHCFGRRER